MSTVASAAPTTASTPRPRSLDVVVRAAARLEGEQRSGRSAYDDLAAPGWDAFAHSRDRYLMAAAARAFTPRGAPGEATTNREG